MSEVFGRLVFEQVEEYLVRYNMLYELQSGFTAADSTDTCLIHLFDFISQNLDGGNYADLQKAFDTVNHSVLLSKLQCMVFGHTAVKWFISYITGRTQVCDVEVVLSEPQDITCVVLHGSILGPLLFLMYINDTTAAVTCKLLLYADDSALLLSGNDVSEIHNS